MTLRCCFSELGPQLHEILKEPISTAPPQVKNQWLIDTNVSFIYLKYPFPESNYLQNIFQYFTLKTSGALLTGGLFKKQTNKTSTLSNRQNLSNISYPLNRLQKLGICWVTVRSQFSIIQAETIAPQFKQNLNLSSIEKRNTRMYLHYTILLFKHVIYYLLTVWSIYFPGGPALRICLPMLRKPVRPLVGELRSYVLQATKSMCHN